MSPALAAAACMASRAAFLPGPPAQPVLDFRSPGASMQNQLKFRCRFTFRCNINIRNYTQSILPPVIDSPRLQKLLPLPHALDAHTQPPPGPPTARQSSCPPELHVPHVRHLSREILAYPDVRRHRRNFPTTGHPGQRLGNTVRERSQQFRALGLASGEFLQGTLSDLHVIVWKFVIIHMVAVDEDGQRFIPRDVWKAAVRRQQGRLVAHAGRTQLKLIRSGPASQSQLDSWSSQVQPLVECYNDDGTQEASSPWSSVLLYCMPLI